MIESWLVDDANRICPEFVNLLVHNSEYEALRNGRSAFARWACASVACRTHNHARHCDFREIALPLRPGKPQAAKKNEKQLKLFKFPEGCLPARRRLVNCTRNDKSIFSVPNCCACLHPFRGPVLSGKANCRKATGAMAEAPRAIAKRRQGTGWRDGPGGERSNVGRYILHPWR